MANMMSIPQEFFRLLELAQKAPETEPLRLGPMTKGAAYNLRRNFYSNRKKLAEALDTEVEAKRRAVAIKAIQYAGSLSSVVWEDPKLIMSDHMRWYVLFTRSTLSTLLDEAQRRM